MRVVVDTNVFINGIFKKDSFAKAIFNLKSLNKISFVMNKEMQNELLVTFGNILLEAIKRIDSKKVGIATKECFDEVIKAINKNLQV